MRVLVTGAMGFTGQHLAASLSGDGKCELYLADRNGRPSGNFFAGDLTQKAPTEELIVKVRPERIYQAAGSFTNDYDIDYPANVLITRNILDSLLKFDIPCRVLLIGSAAEYGFIGSGDNPVKESQPLHPARIYGLTKAFQTYLMQYYHRALRMDLVMARTFNLCGGGTLISRSLFIGKLREGIEKIRSGQSSKIKVGNLESERDYIDVQKAVEYYIKIMEKGRAGEVYNVGSGRPKKLRDLLQELLKESGLGMEVIEEAPPLVPDESDIPCIYADLTKLKGL